jgi:hypothetical protein
MTGLIVLYHFNFGVTDTPAVSVNVYESTSPMPCLYDRYEI